MTSPIGQSFNVTSWRYLDDLPGVEFSYLCDAYGPFCETVIFPMLGDLKARHNEAQAQIITLLHGVLGTSYYKCAAARKIRFDAGPQDRPGQTLIEAVYGQGMGEFFVRAGLGFPYPVAFEWGTARCGNEVEANSRTIPSPSGSFAEADALVGFGGGKDSYVAMDVVRHAVPSAHFFRVRSHMDAPRRGPVPDDGMIYMDRFLDPKLRKVTAQGAFNGHVPVTAMNSLIGLLAAKVLGARNVIFANERSADEGTAMVNGHEVNHQYSKSFELERLFSDAVSACGTEMPRYFSLLRPVSELWIARHLAGLPRLHERFMSCNRNFRIGNEAAMTWCGSCPKCAFTFLLFSPFLLKKQLMEIFGKNLLDDRALIPVFEELVGLKPVKPWDCVGTVEECRTILALIADRAEWGQDAAIKAIAPRLAAGDPQFDARETFNGLLAIEGPHNVPEPFLSALHAAQLKSQAIGASFPFD